jgi:Kef-type K+ transport system membrane component KefB
LTISIAAIEDIVVWVILAVATALSKGGPSIDGLYTLLLTFGFVFIMFIIVRPLLSLLHGYYFRRKDEYNLYLIVVCLLVLLAASFASEVINIHAFFGAFIAGLIIPRRRKGSTLHEFLSVRIELFCIEFFLPLYFTNSGLKTHLYLLNTFQAWYTLLALIFIASISKIMSVTLMTRIVTRKTETWSYAFAAGILMNTRGIVQLVVLNIGVELGVLTPLIFSIFVLMAIILTFFTSPLLYLVYLRKKPTKVKNKLIVKPIEKPLPLNRTHLYTNPIDQFDDNRILRPYRKWRLAPPSS